MSKRTFGYRAAESRGPAYRPAPTETRVLQVSEDIIPIAELKANLSEIVRGLDARPRPLVVTLNGKAAAVVMSPAAYDRLAYHIRVVTKIEAGLADVEAGRVISDEELGKRIAKRHRETLRTRAKGSR